MLVIDRVKNSWLRIGDQIRIQVLRTGSRRVRLGIEAPRSIPVRREELLHRDTPGIESDAPNPPFHVLVVEDDPQHASLIGLVIVEHFSTRLTVATTGEQALKLLSAQDGDGALRPDLILLDLNLPDMSGMEVLTQIKASGGLRTTPVVVLSGTETAHAIRDSLEHGANAFVSKSASFDQFSEAIVRIVDFWRHTQRAA